MTSPSNYESDPTISEHETSWRSKFPKKIVLLLSIIQILFTLLILILEIASLGVILGYNPTGVGIWCALPFAIASILTFILAYKKDGSRVWASRVFITQIILIIFTCILIGITGNYVSRYSLPYSWLWSFMDDRVDRKYKIVQAELAFGILLMFSGLIYIGIYFIVTYIALWKPFHTIDTAHLFRK